MVSIKRFRLRKATQTFLSLYFNLHEPKRPCKKGLYNGLISPFEQSRFILKVSWSSFGSGVIGAFYNKYDMALVCWIAFLTSQLYWSKPTYSWRRNLDITLIQFCLWYHVYRAYNAQHMFYYYSITSVGIFFYFLGWYFHTLNKTWPGTLSHSMVHIFANIANVILYSGEM